MSPRPALVVFALASLVVLTQAEAALAIPPRKVLAPVIYERATQPAPDGRPQRGATWTPELVVRSDGTWRATSTAGASAGQLDRAALRDLQRAIARARYRIDYGVYAMCTGFPSRRIRVKTKAGAVTWAAPCARRPHASVLALDELVERLVFASSVPLDPVVPIDPIDPTWRFERPPIEPPPIEPEPAPPVASQILVSYDEQRFTSIGKGGIVVRVDGSWTSDSGSGVLAPDQLASLRARLQTVTFGPGPLNTQCAARLDGHGHIDAPGLGSHRWSIPCSSLHPTLASLLTELRRLTR
ncbi:MAG: hypothetical protein IT385_17905 [Deltaproteobacteria bacterium]|nr:hypothetical protein [Deltaproteobacteria bacterium]